MWERRLRVVRDFTTISFLANNSVIANSALLGTNVLRERRIGVWFARRDTTAQGAHIPSSIRAQKGLMEVTKKDSRMSQSA